MMEELVQKYKDFLENWYPRDGSASPPTFDDFMRYLAQGDDRG